MQPDYEFGASDDRAGEIFEERGFTRASPIGQRRDTGGSYWEQGDDSFYNEFNRNSH